MKLSLLVLTCITVSFIADFSYCELFTAVVDVRNSLQKERDLAVALDEYVEAEHKRIANVKELANRLRSRSLLVNNSDTDFTHPVQAYQMIKILGHDWQELVKKRANESQNSLENRIRNLSLPSREDVNGAIDAIVRLQKTYDIPAKYMSAGKLAFAASFSSNMSAEECFTIGYYAYIIRDFKLAKDWLTITLDSMNNNGSSSTATQLGLRRSKVLEILALAMYKQGHVQEALDFTNELLQLEPEHKRAVKNRRKFERQILAALKSKPASRTAQKNNVSIHVSLYDSELFQRYTRLCRGDGQVKEVEEKGRRRPLVCRYVRPHPYFYLAPVKEEIAHWRPRIVMWHGILGNAEIDTVKQLAQPLLRRALVYGLNGSEPVPVSYRISKSAWLSPDHHSMIPDIDSRIELLTGLSVASAEQLQVVNYGLGGHYEPHCDFDEYNDTNSLNSEGGDRIATLLYYMSDVTAGGATVFTDLGVQLQPVKGSAAFWYNLRRSGDGELLTRHAACPVLHGSKWVMNKWFHERGQEFRRPCGLSPDE